MSSTSLFNYHQLVFERLTSHLHTCGVRTAFIKDIKYVDELIQIRHILEKDVENSTFGSPSPAALYMFESLCSSAEWAQSIIEKDKANSSYYARIMFFSMHGYDGLEWAKRVISDARCGNPSEDARVILEHFNTFPEINEKILPSVIEWAKSVVENDKTGDPAKVASLMHEKKLCDIEWAKKVVANAVSGQPAIIAMEFVRAWGEDKRWAEDVIKKSIDNNCFWV